VQEGVEGAGAGGAAVHRGEDLDVAARVQPEAGGDAGAGDLDGEGRGGFGVFAGEEEEGREVRW
jgi:hypothetical protein